MQKCMMKLMNIIIKKKMGKKKKQSPERTFIKRCCALRTVSVKHGISEKGKVENKNGNDTQMVRFQV